MSKYADIAKNIDKYIGRTFYINTYPKSLWKVKGLSLDFDGKFVSVVDINNSNTIGTFSDLAFTSGNMIEVYTNEQFLEQCEDL